MLDTMLSIRFTLIFTLPALFVAFFLSRAPFMMTTSVHTGNKLWADGPCPLIATPQYVTKKVRPFVKEGYADCQANRLLD
jgi:hypothetical protein